MLPLLLIGRAAPFLSSSHLCVCLPPFLLHRRRYFASSSMASSSALHHRLVHLQRAKTQVEADLQALPDLPEASTLRDDTQTFNPSTHSSSTPQTEGSVSPQRRGTPPPPPSTATLPAPVASPVTYAAILKGPLNTNSHVGQKDSSSSTAPPVSKQQSVKPLNLTLGQLVTNEKAFCPISAVSKFPYKWVGKPKSVESEAVAGVFFTAGKFWERTWDLYYVWPMDESRPMIFIGYSQFEELIHQIDASLPHLDIKVKPGFYECGLICDGFPLHPRLRPRYLGRSTSRTTYDSLREQVPEATFTLPGEPHYAPEEDSVLEGFKKLMEDAASAERQKGKTSKEERANRRELRRISMMQQLRRTQSYLGVYPEVNSTDLSDPSVIPATTTAESSASVVTPEEAIPPIDITLPPPYPHPLRPVIICVDIEAWERNTRCITEVGISTLDTADIMGVVPGEIGENWIPYIRARHFRIIEHAHKINYRYVRGCPDDFDHGTSEFVGLRDAPAVVAACFRPPYSKEYSKANAQESDQEQPDSGKRSDDPNLDSERPILFLGHDPRNDINYLQILGYNPLNLRHLTEVLDTAVLYRAHTRTDDGRSLGAIMQEIGYSTQNLHNAGNDAYYTMLAMIGIVVKEAQGKGEHLAKKDEDVNTAEIGGKVAEKSNSDEGGAPL